MSDASEGSITVCGRNYYSSGLPGPSCCIKHGRISGGSPGHKRLRELSSQRRRILPKNQRFSKYDSLQLCAHSGCRSFGGPSRNEVTSFLGSWDTFWAVDRGNGTAAIASLGDIQSRV